jgi:hypothetical protein
MTNKIYIVLTTIIIFAFFSTENLRAQEATPIPPANGLSADRPVFLYERNGVMGQPWGAAGNSWPEQLFWNNVPANNNHHLQEMKNAAKGIESDGRVPQLGSVAWGYEYRAATGGDTSSISPLPDMSKVGGWKQWGEWMKDPNHVKYHSTNWYGSTEPGYVTPIMPMDPADWPSEWVAPPNWISPKEWVDNKPVSTISYGQWIGNRLSQLALWTDNRGIYCADYVVGLTWGDAIDYNERVVDNFAAWAGVEIPQGTISQRANYIQYNYKSDWFDYKCARFAEFYCSMGQNLLDNGKTPLIGGQTLGLTRDSGNDFRIYIQGKNGSMTLPGRYWFFNLELQSDDLRTPHLNWESSIRMGVLASREPDMQLGAQLNAFGGQGSFDNALKNAGRDKAWGQNHITQQWLSVGWTHILDRNGLVRRAPMSFMRSYWDAGKTPNEEFELLLKYIPRKPFGPALYYSVAIERQFEKGHGKYSNSWYMCFEKFLRELSPIQHATRQGSLRGAFSGFYVSDASIDHLKPADYPAAWIVYDSDSLPDDERIKLEAIAPIIDPDKSLSNAAKQLFPLCPVYIEQDTSECLNGLAFVDQNKSVIILVSNSKEKDAKGTLVFQHVSNGTFNCKGIIGLPDTALTITDSTGSIQINLPPRSNGVYEIPGLKWRELDMEEEEEEEVEIIDTTSTNINNIDLQAFNVYPNPSNGNFTITFENENGPSSVSIYNITGALMYQKKLEALPKHEIQLNGIKKGFYLVKLKNRLGHHVKRIAIQ